MNTVQTTVYLSSRGRKEFEKAISKLKREREKLIASLHEHDKVNTHDGRYERIERLARLDSVEAEIRHKQEILLVAKPFPKVKREMKKVSIGSQVELINSRGTRLIYTIVDTIEADPSAGRISIASPLGKELLGKIPFDTIKWPGKTKRMQLVRIS